MGKRKKGKAVKRVLVSMENELLQQVDARAESLGLSRSEYLYRLAEQDIRKGGPIELIPKTPPDPEPVEPADVPAPRVRRER